MRAELSEWIEDYLETARLKNFTSKTITGKREVIQHLWFGIFQGEPSEESVRKFIVWLYDVRKVKPRTIKTYLLFLKSFLRYLHKEGLITGNWIDNIPIPKIPKTPIYVVEPLVAKEAIEKACSGSGSCLTTKRREENKQVLMFLLYTGLRLGELLALTPDNFDFDSRMFWVQTEKTQNIRYIPIPLPMIDELRTRMNNEKIFQVSKDTLNRTLYRGSGLLGLKKRLHVHQLRHIFATCLLRRGAKLERVADLLGHEDLNTTRSIYGHFEKTDSEFVLNTFHPLISEYAPVEQIFRAVGSVVNGVIGDGTNEKYRVNKTIEPGRYLLELVKV